LKSSPLGGIHPAQTVQQCRARGQDKIHRPAVGLDEIVLQDHVAGVGNRHDETVVVVADGQEEIAAHALQRKRIQDARLERRVGQIQDREIVKLAESLGKNFFGQEADLDQVPTQTAPQTISLLQDVAQLCAAEVAFGYENVFQRPILCHISPTEEIESSLIIARVAP
jgi:hypothetical protein